MQDPDTGVRRRRGATAVAPTAQKPSPAPVSKNGVVYAKSHQPPPPVAPAASMPRPDESARFGSGVVFLCMFVGFAAIIASVRYLDDVARLHRDYDPNNADALEPMSLYSEEKAMRHIEHIAKSPRWIGSKALDRSLEYALRQIEGMVEVARSNGMLLEVESFTSAGSYPCATGPVMVVVSYDNVLSVVARISPIAQDDAPEADRDLDADNSQGLLVNAHIDSGMGSPGANDNVVGVGVALESLRSIASMSQKSNRLSRPIVFLFNGAEEPLLAGAHGFMSSHRWAQGLAAHINFESIGSGKTYHLFQMGPGNSWLADAYAKAVRTPSGTSASSDVFDYDFIPAETDFHIFKEFGLPGYDFALVGNGHVYHTVYDDVKHVEMDAVIYGGKFMLLPLAMELAGRSDAIGRHIRELKVPAATWSLGGPDSRVIYFDVLHSFQVTYSNELGVLLNVASLLLWALVWGIQLRGTSHRRKFSPETKLRMVGVFFATVLSVFASGFILAMFILHVLERPLAWYGSFVWAFAIYMPSFFIGSTIALQLLIPATFEPDLAYDGMLFAVSSFYALELLAVTLTGFRVGYLYISMLIPTLLVATGIVPRKPAILSFVVMLFPSIVTGAITFNFTGSLLLSLLGRSGSATTEGIASALVAVAFCQYFFLQLLPVLARFPASLRRLRKFWSYIAVLMIFIVWILPELTLPHRSSVYSRDAPKRIMAVHFHSPDMSPPNVLGIVGLDVIPVDVNTTVRMFPFSERDALQDVSTWGSLNSTILENARPYQQFLAPPTMFAIDDPLDLAVPVVKVVEEHMDEVAGDRANVTISIEAPDALMVSLRVLVRNDEGGIRAWSFNAPIEDLGDGGGCWVRHVGRGAGVEKLEFSVLVEAKSLDVRPKIPIAVTSSRPGKSRSEVLKKLYFPMWASPVLLQSTGISLTL